MDRANDARKRRPSLAGLSRGFFLAGILLGGVTFAFRLNTESSRIRADLRNTSTERSTAIQAQILAVQDLMNAFSAFLLSSERVYPEEFSSFAEHLAWRRPGVDNIGWVPRVTAAARTEYENGMGVTRKILSFEGEGKLLPAAEAPEYFPLTYVSLNDPTQKIPLGFDLASEPMRREAIRAALMSGRFTVSSLVPVNNREQALDGRRAIALLPIIDNRIADSGEPSTPQISGFIAAVMNIPELVESILENGEVSGQDLYLVDRNSDAEGTPELIHFHPSRSRPDTFSPLSASQLRRTQALAAQIMVAGREWALYSVAVRSPWSLAWMPALREPLAVLTLFFVAALLTRGMDRLRQRVLQRQARDSNTIDRLRLFDPVTGLPNRASALVELESLMHERRSVLMINIRRFRHVLETVGYAGGDEVLKIIARRLNALISQDHFLARLDGDEFVILSADAQAIRFDQERMALRVRRALQETIDIDENSLHLQCSISGAIAERGALSDGADLLTRAALAMRAAKRKSIDNALVLDSDADAVSLRRQLSIEAALRTAIEQRIVTVKFQPQFTAGSLKLHGFEALVRWQHDHRAVPPPEIFMIAEEAGLLQPLDELIIDASLQQAAHWRMARPGKNGRIAVNMSADQFARPDFVPRILRALERHHAQGSWLELELTESALVEDIDHTRATLHQLNEAGIHTSLDDFGTGFSSLSHLKLLPVQWLKIDRSFVTNIARDRGDAAIVKATIGMARSMNVRILAEGVESTEQLAHLQAFGCDAVQGFLFSPAVSAVDARAFYDGFHVVPTS